MVDPRDLLAGYFSEFPDLMDSEFQKGQDRWGDGWLDADPWYMDRRVEDCFHQYRKAREAHADEQAAVEAIASMANYALMGLALAHDGGARLETDGGTDVESDGDDLWDPEPPEWPEPNLDRYRPGLTDFLLDPEIIINDRDHWDHNYRSPGELGRVTLGVQFIGEDGFADWFDYINGPPLEIIPDRYGGIYASQDASTDYVAFSPACIEHSPEDIQDALAVARSPYVAAAALRAWYDRQFGVNGQMVRRNDHYKHRRRREEREGWKAEGVTFQFTENETEDRPCERCTTHIPVGAKVWTITIPPGREKEGRCTVCARGAASASESDEYNLNGPDPREEPLEMGVGSDE